MLDAFVAGKFDAVLRCICYAEFINTMKQEPVRAAAAAVVEPALAQRRAAKTAHGWDYIYEPNAATVIDELLLPATSRRLVYQAVAENMASSSRRAWWAR